MHYLKYFWFLIPSLAFYMADGDDPPPPAPKPEGDGDPPPQDDDPKITLTQKQLDAMFKPRTDEAAKKAQAALLEQLGVDDLDTAKAALDAAKKAEEAQLSELEKAQKATDAANAERDRIKAEADEALAQARRQLLQAAVIAEASKQGFVDPADAWLHIDPAKIEAGEDGAYTGLDKLVEAVAESKPYLVKAETPASPNGTPRPKPRPAGQPQPEPEPQRPLIRL